MRFRVPIPRTYHYVLDLILHVIFLIVSGIIVYSTIDPNQRQYVMSLENNIKSKAKVTGELLMKVTDLYSMRMWMYRRWQRLITGYPGYFLDGRSLYLAYPTFRQVRIVNGTCFTQRYQKDPKIKVRMTVQRCNPQSATEDTANYFGFWSSTTNIYTDGFQYTPQYSTGLSTHFGTYDSYSGGGYIKMFSTNGTSLYDGLTYLNLQKWWDHLSRATFLETALYNSDANLISFVRVVFETPAIGGVTPSLKIQTVPVLTKYKYPWGLLVVSTVIGIIVSLLQIILEVIKVRQMGIYKYAQSGPTWLTAVAIMMFLMVVGFIFDFINTINNIINAAAVSGTQNYDNIMTAIEQYRSFVVTGGILMSVELLKLASFLSWHRGCRIILSALKRATSVILAFTTMAFMVFMAFSSGFYLLVVDRMARFSSVFASMEGTLQMMFGYVDLSELSQDQCYLFMALRFIFVCTVTFYILTMFMGIMIRIYAEVRQQLHYNGAKFTVLQVLGEKFTRFTGVESSEKLTFPNMTPSQHCGVALNLRMALILHNLETQKKQQGYFGPDIHPEY